MASNQYVVEYAKTGRAKCKFKKCSQLIAAQTMRIGKISPNPFGEEGDTMTSWFHAPCMFLSFKRARKTTKTIKSADDCEGFEGLKEADKQLFLAYLEGECLECPGEAATAADVGTGSSGSAGDASAKKTKKKKADEEAGGGGGGVPSTENEALIEHLSSLGKEYFEQDDRRRGMCYRKAAAAIREHTAKITSGKQAKKLKGIGDSIANVVDLFLEGGGAEDDAGAGGPSVDECVVALQRIYGVDEKAGRALVEKGFTKVSDLLGDAATQELNGTQQAGFRYLRDLEVPLEAGEAERMRSAVAVAVPASPGSGASAAVDSAVTLLESKPPKKGKVSKRGVVPAGTVELVLGAGADAATVDAIVARLTTAGAIVETLSPQHRGSKGIAFAGIYKQQAPSGAAAGGGASATKAPAVKKRFAVPSLTTAKRAKVAPTNLFKAKSSGGATASASSHSSASPSAGSPPPGGSRETPAATSEGKIMPRRHRLLILRLA